MSRRAALSVVNSVVGAVMTTAALVFVAKNMGPSVLGVLGYALATVGILSFLSDFGMGSVHINHMRSGEDPAKCVGAYATIKLVIIAFFAIVALVPILLWRNGILGEPTPERHFLVDTLEVFVIYYILLGVSQIATHTFDAKGAPAKALIPALLEVVVRVLFIIYVATSSFRESPDGSALLASSYVAGIVAATLLAAIFMTQVKASRPDRAILTKYVQSLTPVFVVSMVIILNLYLDKTVVGYFWGAKEVGLYFGVQKMAVFVGVFSLSVATLILPSVTTYFTRDDVAASWDVVNQAERYVSLVVVPTAAFYLAFGSDILTVFLTPEFAENVRTMDVLVIGSAIVALVLPLRSAVAGVGMQRLLFYVGSGAILLQLGMMIVLVPDRLFGIKMPGLKGFGAAIALLVSSVYYFFILRYIAWRTAKVAPNSRSFRHVASAGFMVGVAYSIDWLFIPTVDGLSLIILAVIGVFSYGTAAYMLGELEASDYRYFRYLLNPKDTFQYCVSELLGKQGH